MCLQLKYDELLHNFTFTFYLRRYILGTTSHVFLTLVLLAAQFVLALVTPNIEVALGFMGSTLSAGQCKLTLSKPV